MGFDMFIALLFMLAVGFFSGYCVHKGNTIDYRQRWKKAIAILDTDEVAQALIEHNVWYDKAQGKAGKAHTMPVISPSKGIPQSTHYSFPSEKQKKFMEMRRKEKEDADFRKRQRKYEDECRRKIREEFYSVYATPPAILPASSYHDPYYIGRAIPAKTTSDWDIKYLDNP